MAKSYVIWNITKGLRFCTLSFEGAQEYRDAHEYQSVVFWSIDETVIPVILGWSVGYQRQRRENSLLNLDS